MTYRAQALVSPLQAQGVYRLEIPIDCWLWSIEEALVESSTNPPTDRYSNVGGFWHGPACFVPSGSIHL